MSILARGSRGGKSGDAGLPARGGRPPEHLRRFGGGAVGPFSQMLLVGLVVCGLSLPLGTAVPALAAGVRQLDAHLENEDDALRTFWGRFRAALRGGGWAVGTATAALLALLTLNASGSFQGLVPGGALIGWASIAIGAGVVLVVSRAAALWRPGAQWRTLLRDGADLAVADPVGSLFILTGYGVAVVVVWMLAPLVIITPGMVALAIVASERRRRTLG